MQTTKTTPYHCAELRRSVPVLQRIEWGSIQKTEFKAR